MDTSVRWTSGWRATWKRQRRRYARSRPARRRCALSSSQPGREGRAEQARQILRGGIAVRVGLEAMVQVARDGRVVVEREVAATDAVVGLQQRSDPGGGPELFTQLARQRLL